MKLHFLNFLNFLDEQKSGNFRFIITKTTSSGDLQQNKPNKLISKVYFSLKFSNYYLVSIS